MSIEEMLLSRRCLFDFYAQEKKKDVTFLKVHDSFSSSENDMGIFLDEAITSIIYIVRDPRDVALSFAGHLGVSVDKIIDIMAQQNFSLAPYEGGARRFTPQILSSWSNHVSGWLDSSPVPLHLVRYEDMLSHPEMVFGDLAKILNLKSGADVLAAAISSSSFNVLRQQEEKFGFRERPINSERFFSTGRSGEWKRKLTEDQRKRLVSNHGMAMERLGYEV